MRLAYGGNHLKGQKGIPWYRPCGRMSRASLNWCLMSVIVFYHTLHGFKSGQGAGNTSLEAKLL